MIGVLKVGMNVDMGKARDGGKETGERSEVGKGIAHVRTRGTPWASVPNLVLPLPAHRQRLERLRQDATRPARLPPAPTRAQAQRQQVHRETFQQGMRTTAQKLGMPQPVRTPQGLRGRRYPKRTAPFRPRRMRSPPPPRPQ